MSLFCQLILPKATFLILSYLADEVTLTCYYTQQLLPLLFLSFSLNGSLICTQEEVQNLSSHAAAAAKSLQSCPTLCDPVDGSPPGSSVPGILQVRILEWVAISFSNAWNWKVKVKVKVNSCQTLSDPMDCSLLDTSVHGIFQARVLEWVAIAFSLQPWGTVISSKSQLWSSSVKRHRAVYCTHPWESVSLGFFFV